MLTRRRPGGRFLGGGAEGEQAEGFKAFRAEAEASAGVAFCRTVEELPEKLADAPPRVALIAARAVDFPALFHAALAKGFDHIYLEKPGAPDVPSMQKMAAAAKVPPPYPPMWYAVPPSRSRC